MSMTIADNLRSYSNAYPIDIFPDPEPEQLESMHLVFPNLAGRIWAKGGRTFAEQALEGANELDRMEARIEYLEKKLAGKC